MSSYYKEFSKRVISPASLLAILHTHIHAHKDW